MTFADEYAERVAQWSDVQYCMPAMLEAARSRPFCWVLEVGVRSGNSTAAFLAGVEESRGHVWSVDMDVPQVPGHWHGSALWTFVQGDDLTVQPPEDTFDVVFIDTIHTYLHTLAELGRFIPLVKPGGTVLLHDTMLEKVDGEEKRFPVAAALDAFCDKTGRNWVEHGGEYGFGEIACPNG